MFQERIENIDKEGWGKTIKVIQEIEKEPGRTVRNEKCNNLNTKLQGWEEQQIDPVQEGISELEDGAEAITRMCKCRTEGKPEHMRQRLRRGGWDEK